MAVAALWQAIDLTAADGGLASCLKAANVAPTIIKKITDTNAEGGLGMETLRDFASSYTTEDHCVTLDAIWLADEATKANRVQRGRLHSAWQAAATAIKKVEDTPKADGSNGLSTDISWEAPLTDTESEKMWGDWKNKYAVRHECHVLPGDPLLNRLHREMRQHKMSVIDVRKWKSVLHERQPDRVTETQVTTRAKLVEGVISEYRPCNIIEYYWGLRTLCNAMAIAGNYEVQSSEKEGLKVIMMPADQALNYADRGLRLASGAQGDENDRFAWWAKKDYMTRTLMTNYVRDRMPAREAMAQASRTHCPTVAKPRQP